MKYDELKAFPYPVLREGSDDYENGAFQAALMPEVTGTDEGMAITIAGEFQLSVDSLRGLIEEGKAAYSLTIDCRNTFTRRYFEYQNPEFEQTLEPGEIDGEFTVSPAIVAKQHIADFLCGDIHHDFGAGPFIFGPGSVLAQAEDLIFHVSREHFAPITSIFVLSAEDKVPENCYKVELSGEKVTVFLHSNTKAVVLAARSQQKYLSVVFNAVYLPTLVRVISALNEEGADQKYQGKLWYEVVTNQLHAKGFDPPIEDPAFVAQVMLGRPLRHLTEKFTEIEGEV